MLETLRIKVLIFLWVEFIKSGLNIFSLFSYNLCGVSFLYLSELLDSFPSLDQLSTSYPLCFQSCGVSESPFNVTSLGTSWSYITTTFQFLSVTTFHFFAALFLLVLLVIHFCEMLWEFISAKWWGNTTICFSVCAWTESWIGRDQSSPTDSEGSDVVPDHDTHLLFM